MISRHWKGLSRRELADRYVEHLKADTFPQLASLRGFVRASVLRRELPEGVEFQVVTLWQSLADIAAFAGDDIEAAVVPANVQAMMIRYDDRAAHYEVVETLAASPDA